MKKRVVKVCLCAALCSLFLSSVSFGALTWSFVGDYSGTPTVWKYYAGEVDNLSNLDNTNLMGYVDPIWEKSKNDSLSRLSVETGVGKIYSELDPNFNISWTPILQWVSDGNYDIDVNISIKNATSAYQAAVFLNSDKKAETSGNQDDLTYVSPTSHLSVAPGSTITLWFSADSPDNPSLADVSFVVTQVPEPATITMIGFGLASLVMSRKRKSTV